MSCILALDTSTAACSVALWRGGVVVAGRLEMMARGHAENLMPMVDAVIREAGERPDALDLVAVTVGPGAFTGLRLGLAAARGLAVATGAACLGLTTTETLAAALPDPAIGEIILAGLDSKRGDVYLQAFDARRRPLAAPEAVSIDAVASYASLGGGDSGACVLAGDAQAACAAALAAAGRRTRRTETTVPDAAVLAALAAARWRPGEDAPPPVPLYLRPPDAAKPKHGGRLRR